MNGQYNKGKGISLGRSHNKTDAAQRCNAVAAIAEESHKFHSWEYVKVDINAFRSQIVDAIRDLFEERGHDVKDTITLKAFIPCFNIEYYSDYYEGDDTTQVGDLVFEDGGFTIISAIDENIELGDGAISTDELYRFYEFLNENLEENLA